jgi:hypothetical protein
MNFKLTLYKEVHRIIYCKTVYGYVQLDTDYETDIHVI